jgi:4a-hydroxytetrahydrobiopterin dehydratase
MDENPADRVVFDKRKVSQMVSGLGSNWSVKNGRLQKEFEFKDFVSALLFVNEIGAIAERENHHPHIELDYGRVRVSIYTHSVNALTLADFILAEQIGEIRF